MALGTESKLEIRNLARVTAVRHDCVASIKISKKPDTGNLDHICGLPQRDQEIS